MPQVYHKQTYYQNGQLCYDGMAYDQNGRTIPHGQGKKYSEDGGLVYEGMYSDGNWSWGKWYYTGGSPYYEGTFLDNKPCGRGRIYYTDGALMYEGEVADDKRSGKGKAYDHSNGLVYYEGDWAQDEPNGQGRWFYDNGQPSYEGAFRDGQRSGQGREFYYDGSLRYEGEFAGGKRSGRGKLYGEDGVLLYEGQWADDKRSGNGKGYDHSNGLVYYEGDWAQDEPDGQGRWFYDNGQPSYEGAFRVGQRSGQGREFYADGSLRYEGEFAGGKRSGQGKLYGEDGKLQYEGEFKDGEPVTPVKAAGQAAPDLEASLKELNSMIGLEEVKRRVNSLVNLIRVQKTREERGLPITPITYHMVFTGNPGTGKTTVARLIGQIYAALGVVTNGNVVETDRTGLVGQFIGETEQKTEKLIQEALGGILFVDEAYALVKEGSSNDFGKEAIDCILKRMEDYRKDFVVIVAGYQEPMEAFLLSNPGLKSRFNQHINFDNYTLPELWQILEFRCKKDGYTIGPGVQELFTSEVGSRLQDRKFMENFSNGRYVRNIFEKLVMAQSNRLSQIDISTASDEALTEIAREDFQYLMDTGEFSRIF